MKAPFKDIAGELAVYLYQSLHDLIDNKKLVGFEDGKMFVESDVILDPMLKWFEDNDILGKTMPYISKVRSYKDISVQLEKIQKTCKRGKVESPNIKDQEVLSSAMMFILLSFCAQLQQYKDMDWNPRSLNTTVKICLENYFVPAVAENIFKTVKEMAKAIK